MHSLPKTEEHYLEDKRELFSKVVWTGEVNGAPVLIVNQTIFYPEAGGQPADEGWLVLQTGEQIRVVGARKTENSIVLLLDPKAKERIPSKDEQVTQRIDWDLRMAHVRHHSACHLLLPVFQEILGEIRPHGAGLSADKARIDLEVEGKISSGDLRRIENRAYKLILENRPMISQFLPREKAETQYGIDQLYWSEPPPPEATTIRITQIQGMPAYACGGTHVSSTAEIGLIKFVSRSRLEGGVDRIELVAGAPAFKLIQQQLKALEKTSRVFESGLLDVPTFANRLKLRIKTLDKELKDTKDELLKYKTDDFLKTAKPIGQYKLFAAELEDFALPDLENLVKSLVEKDPDLVALAGSVAEKAMLAGATGENVPDVRLLNAIREATSLLGGGAGGGPTFARGGGPKRNKLKDALKQAKATIIKHLQDKE
ncbi:MAG: DHHA1 domain-containing protein [Candidatus Heimdallarchaeota archaeon]